MDLVLRVAGAVLLGFVFSQSAEVTQQYFQRLGGGSDALASVVHRFDASAATVGLSRADAVGRLKGDADAFVSRQGADAAATIARYENLSRHYLELADAPPLFRPFVAASDLDRETFSDALQDYRPALPTTPDGLALTLAGVGAGWALGAGAAAGVARRRRAARRPAQGHFAR